MPRKRKAIKLDDAQASAEDGADNAAAASPSDEPTDAAPSSAAPPPPFTALPLRHVDHLIEPGPILLVSTGSVADGSHNLMTLGFHMMLQHRGPTLIGICLGPWDASYATLRARRECVLAIPSAEMAEAVVDIGNCSKTDEDGEDENKWERFHLTPLPAQAVRAPLVGGPHIMANIECVVHDSRNAGRYALWILKVVRAWWDEERVQRTGRMLHHTGTGKFRVSEGTEVDLQSHMTKWEELA